MKLNYDNSLSSVAFNCYLRHYTKLEMQKLEVAKREAAARAEIARLDIADKRSKYEVMERAREVMERARDQKVELERRTKDEAERRRAADEERLQQEIAALTAQQRLVGSPRVFEVDPTLAFSA